MNGWGTMQDEPRTIRAMRNFNPLRFCAPGAISAADRHRLISQAAYLRAKQRGFAAGHEVERPSRDYSRPKSIALLRGAIGTACAASHSG